MLLWTLGASFAEAKPRKPDEHTPDAKLDRLKKEVQAKDIPIVEPCDSAGSCALARFRARLDARKAGDGSTVRVLQLGDSHIAADFISGFVRTRLQDRFGDAGRGLVHADQRWGYGGRRTARRDADWRRPRVVDAKGPGKKYGLFGLALVAKRRGSPARYRIVPEDAKVEVFFEAGPSAAGFALRLGGKPLGSIDARADAPSTRSQVFELPPSLEGADTLEIIAEKAGARLYGLGFYSGEPGLVWTSIGPVGADARVYLQADRTSFMESLQIHRPDLVVLMVGGNDALKVRKRWKTLDRVRADHEALVKLLREALPNVEVLVLSPMDAGKKKGKRVVSKPVLASVRDLHEALARSLKLGFWDTYAAMGGQGSVGRWVSAGVFSADLVHPKKPAADLLGRLLSDALLRWHENEGS